MSGRTPTPEQRAAIDTDAPAVLVEAGAGTGKTGVMVDRYCRLVCERGVPPEAILAFTFTEKAATELRQRIRAALEARSAAGEERAGELLPALGGAWVTTIHGFCNRVLAGHPVAAGIDPGFRVLDAGEAERAAAEAFDRALEEFIAEPEPGREELVAAYDVAALRALVVAVHGELRSRGEEPRLPPPPDPDLAGALRRAEAAAAEALEELKPSDAKRELVERALATFPGAAEEPDLDRLAALRTKSGAKAMAAYREAIEDLIGAAAEAGEGGRAYRHLGRLLELFHARFAAAKERRAGVDFEDLQLLAVRLLERTEAGAAFRNRFSHILVDEFQDTNRLQLRLIEALHGPGAQLMAVGDELQSIYGFRHADLDVFRGQREAIGARPDGAVLELSGNFRSRPEVIGAVNALGAALLGERYRELRVGSLPGDAAPPGGGDAVELLLTGREGWEADQLEPATDARTPADRLAEARFLASRLRQLADAGVERGSMVVLLRAFTHLDAYEDSLERAGLRPYVVGGRGYWSHQQVADVCALLATIANPLDDQALFGALASPACGVAPDTLWLLRAAAGRRANVWPALQLAAGLREEGELADPGALEAIPAAELELLRRFGATLEDLRRRAPFLGLAELIEEAVSRSGYDLAILMRSAGEARFANVRKLMRLAAEYEAGDGRDLRGLLDFLAARAGADADPQAATALEGHDGVRIMTVHSAKGLEFDVVAVPGLGRRLLGAGSPPPLVVGREGEEPGVGMRLRRVGAGAVDLYGYRALTEAAQQRDAEEELRLFHVAATRARQRLLLSGTIAAKPAKISAGTPVAERIAAAFDLSREEDGEIAVPPPQPRPGLEASFPPSRIPVRLNLASPERAAALTATRREPPRPPTAADGPAPLLAPTPPPAPDWPLSYTEISARGGSLVEAEGGPTELAAPPLAAEPDAGQPPREEARERGIAVHALLEWSQAHGWAEPEPDLVRRLAAAAGLDPEADGLADSLLAPLRAWLDSNLFATRVLPAARSRAEVPLLMRLDGTVLRGSIDLLVEAPGQPPLIVDYKTDRLAGRDPAACAERYAVQRAIYALAVAEARDADEVEVAYVFLERPEEPVVTRIGGEQLPAARAALAEEVARLRDPAAIAGS